MLLKQFGFALAAILFGIISATIAKLSTPADKQFIYTLQFTPQFKQAISWGPKESEIVKEHVQYLKDMVDNGDCYLAGRTSNPYDPNLLGVVVFDAANQEEAKKIMENDPMIKNEIMTGNLQPFTVVFLKELKK